MSATGAGAANLKHKDDRNVVAASKGQYHVVQPGDTLSRIAEKYGISVEALSSLNKIPKDQTIYPNQKILIPSGN